jgi:hypothetical protein
MALMSSRLKRCASAAVLVLVVVLVLTVMVDTVGADAVVNADGNQRHGVHRGTEATRGDTDELLRANVEKVTRAARVSHDDAATWDGGECRSM